jgi:zinc transporter ZupT
MVLSFLPIVFGIVFMITHLISERIHFQHKERIISFSIGVSLTYIFVQLFPEIIQKSRFDETIIFFFVLIGIIIIRLIEIHAYKHRKKKILKKELKEVHSITFFAYHFVTGMLLFEFLKISLIDGILFFIPLLMHSSVSSTSLNEIHGSIRTVGIYKIVLSLSTLIGVFVMYFISPPPFTFDVLLGIVIGALIYIVMRDAMPKARKARPKEFLAGVLFYSFIIFVLGILS